MQIALKPELERFIQGEINAGRYPSAAEVVQAGLKLLQDREEDQIGIRAKIATGLDQARRGELLDGEQVLEELFGPLDNREN